MSEPVARGSAGHIVMAEDDASASRVLRMILEQSGYRVTVAGDGETALRILEEEGAPDVLLLDWMLPGVTGLEVCHWARQRWDALRLPILMVTAKTDPESVYAAFDAGASDYVGKPFRGAELRARIEAHLRIKRLWDERRRMEDHLAERDKIFTLGLLAGGMAHDLNNPLAVIGTHAQLLQRRAPDEQTAAQLREIVESVDRCARIVSDMLGFARRHPAERHAVDIAEVVRATLALRERDLAASGIALELDAPEGLPLVSADRHQLQQVFLNVVLNAEQALAEEGSRLSVRVMAEGDPAAYVTVEIWNDGPPIPAGQVSRIFDPLFTTKADDKGTGLGLFICRRIVTDHGGEIDARSGPGGTAFTVRLPLPD